ncbi:hypothetical protein [Meiothermus granaticius]|uniref:Uncharacterized protein n=1 Tax=Meiothermus granaticius NBRC 107808 TaxID=1227551 RepID=A0A399FCC2_9DEIN|nr:hypothetical protein [Meiothermus granaticius]MCL6526574.1 hypothetical protein [Thermaceae bacterium]RIH93863.1 hypothetical protein Mgrana_00212 [Meiothermus granaticius NBRC 107808]GEM86359.1 hypothetical protein MGR01S_09840 [Meiothermus granaticius NBRC 107808]
MRKHWREYPLEDPGFASEVEERWCEVEFCAQPPKDLGPWGGPTPSPFWILGLLGALVGVLWLV